MIFNSIFHIYAKTKQKNSNYTEYSEHLNVAGGKRLSCRFIVHTLHYVVTCIEYAVK